MAGWALWLDNPARYARLLDGPAPLWSLELAKALGIARFQADELFRDFGPDAKEMPGTAEYAALGAAKIDELIRTA